jgi:hypothetical protein
MQDGQGLRRAEDVQRRALPVQRLHADVVDGHDVPGLDLQSASRDVGQQAHVFHERVRSIREHQHQSAMQ